MTLINKKVFDFSMRLYDVVIYIEVFKIMESIAITTKYTYWLYSI